MMTQSPSARELTTFNEVIGLKGLGKKKYDNYMDDDGRNYRGTTE